MAIKTVTWADGFGRWTAKAKDRRTAQKAIRRELVAREEVIPGSGYRVKVEPVPELANTWRERWW